MQTMGIDIGTTSISLVLMDAGSGKHLAHKTINHHSFLKSDLPEHKIQDPERILNFVRKAVFEISREYGAPDRIGFTGQMHGMLYVDAEGNAVSPLYTWQDGCGNLPLTGGKTSAQVLKENAPAAASGYGLTTHFYLLNKGEVPQTAVKMSTISDYVAMKLCGLKEPVICTDMAASWGCFDLAKRAFLTEELKKLGVDPSILPAVTLGPKIIGRTEEGVPVMNSLGDNQASVLGSLEDPEHSVLVNIGTGSQVSFISRAFVPLSGDIELRPLLGDMYLMAGSGLCGGRAYAMLEQFYRAVTGSEKEVYGNMAEQAQAFLAAAGAEKAWKVRTTFSGTRDNPDEKGSISNIGIDNFTPGAFTVGMMMGILEELHEDYVKMCEVTGTHATKLVGSGNGIRKNPLMQKLAEQIFGMELSIPGSEEEAATGAARIALTAEERQ